MVSLPGFFRTRVAALVLVLGAASFNPAPARADDGFPLGLEMTLDVARQPGSKRIPTLDIGDAGEVILELWCKGGKGQFSVAGNTVIFVAGPMEERSCPQARAWADDELDCRPERGRDLEVAGRFCLLRRNQSRCASASIPTELPSLHARLRVAGGGGGGGQLGK